MKTGSNKRRCGVLYLLESPQFHKVFLNLYVLSLFIFIIQRNVEDVVHSICSLQTYTKLNNPSLCVLKDE